jgi:tetratricopeptide (TPR) repeat protein
MWSQHRHRARRSLALALSGLLLLAGSAHAANYTLNPRVGKKFNKVYEAMQAEDFETAHKILNSFDAEDMKDYPAALVYQTRGYIAGNQENFAEAAKQFELCLGKEALPPGSQLSVRFNLAQIYLMLEQWERSINNFQIWFKQSESPNALAYYMLAIAYYQSGDAKKALEPAKTAVDMTDAPKEGWLQLLLALYMEQKQYKKAVPLLEDLVSRFPKKSYWIQLAAVYSELGRDLDSLAAQQLAHAQGLLTTDRELTRLAQLYLFNDLPFAAARVIQQGLDDGLVEDKSSNWRLLGDAWLAAREYEKALAPLHKAAELSDDGDLYLRLGQVYVQREEWSKAVETLGQALGKGSLKDIGNAHLLIGIANYNQKKIGAARTSFAKARDSEKTKESANRWLKHIEREQRAQPG